MWKLLVAFILFAAAALYFISKGGDSVDMSGEKHGGDTHAPAATEAAPVATPPSAPMQEVASAASA